jgi:cytochrome c biogenesis protein CcmG/thiol:disulfide interchange protein DsbE
MSRSVHEAARNHPSVLDPRGIAAGRRRRRWFLLAAVASASTVLAALLAYGLTRDPGAIRSQIIGRPAPDFALAALDGSGPVKLADLRGQVVLINFWASWCRECRVEHPSLEAAWQRYRDKGVVFLGIPFQDPPSASRAYLQEMGGEWPILQDQDARTALAFGVYGVPQTYLIGPDGRVRYWHVGPVDYGVLSDRIARLLEEDQ